MSLASQISALATRIAGEVKTKADISGQEFTGPISSPTLFGINTGDQTTVSGSAGSAIGNAGSATKLLTARTINGVAFDGTANITLAGGGTATDTEILGYMGVFS